jgi:pyridoxamine 5'-phosphate oxidase
MSDPLRARLRALPTSGTPLGLDPAAVGDDPAPLFVEWLERAVDDGLLAPHAATLATSDAHGDVSARTLILKDVDDRGWWFASRTDGRKQRDLDADSRAALVFFWPEHGRQVRVAGRAMDAGPDAAEADFLARPAASRAAAVLGAQSAPLASREEYVAGLHAEMRRAQAEPMFTRGTWQAWILEPTRVEFWATTAVEGQIRLAYDRDRTGTSWSRSLLWP